MKILDVSNNVIHNPLLVGSSSEGMKKEGIIDRTFREYGLYHRDNTEAKAIIQRQVDLIADPVKLDAYVNNKKNEMWEWFKYISIYLFVRSVWKEISKASS